MSRTMQLDRVDKAGVRVKPFPRQLYGDAVDYEQYWSMYKEGLTHWNWDAVVHSADLRDDTGYVLH